jgi:hypothetical protein
MANLSQVLDGVLRNVEVDKMQAKMEEMEKTVVELQGQITQTRG